MKQLIIEKKFEKDYQLYLKRNSNLDALDEIVLLLRQEKPLPARCRPHKLQGKWKPSWE